MPDGFPGLSFADAGVGKGRGKGGSAGARDGPLDDSMFWWQSEGRRPDGFAETRQPPTTSFPARSEAKYPGGFAQPDIAGQPDSRQMQEYMQQYMMQQYMMTNYSQLLQQSPQAAATQMYPGQAFRAPDDLPRAVDVSVDKPKPGDENPYPHYAPAVIRDSSAGNVQLVQMPMPVQVPPGWMLVPVDEEEQEKEKQRSADRGWGVPPIRHDEGKGEGKSRGKGKDAPSRNKGQAVAKIFVGGLGPHTTAESLRQHFSRFGTITDSSVVNKPGTNESRGFGFVEFENGIPTVVLEKQHIVDNRRCSVRAYNYSPA